jgi:integrase/recombinase XerD
MQINPFQKGESTPSVSMFLDSRRQKNDGTYPVKLRVFYRKNQRLYKTAINCTEEDYNSAIVSTKVRKEFLELRTKLQAVELKSKKIISSMEVFDWNDFEKRMFGNSSSSVNALEYYKDYESQLLDDEKILTAENYKLSRKSLIRFLQHIGSKTDVLPFNQITVDFLKQYEKWMLSEERSFTTIGFYLRPLRAIINLGIENGNYSSENYPFGKRRYVIPGGQNVKRALSKEDLKKLFEFPTESPFQEKARAFWFFSYNCNGVNVRDIAELKFKNIEGDKIIFRRTKTMHTNKANQKSIVAFINPFMQSVLDKYSNSDKSPENYVFPVMDDSMNKEVQVAAARAFTRFINQHVKILAESAGINQNISSYWARHSFTTTAIRKGNSLEMLQEALGHSDMKTTMKYWSGFEDESKKELSAQLMEF